MITIKGEENKEILRLSIKEDSGISWKQVFYVGPRGENEPFLNEYWITVSNRNRGVAQSTGSRIVEED